MANKYWVNGTGTWDGTTGLNDNHWDDADGGAGGDAGPGTSDIAIFNANSGGGTVTVSATINVQAITCGAFAGTIDFANNNVNLTAASGFNNTGTGARTITAGTGTWTSSVGTGVAWDCTTTTNMTNPTTAFSSATVNFTNTAGGLITCRMGSMTYGTVNRSANIRGMGLSGAFTITNLNIAAPQLVSFETSITSTIGTLAVTGSSSTLLTTLKGTSDDATQATISIGNAPTLTWVACRSLIWSGAGSGFTATNSFDLGRNSGATFTSPSGGVSSTYVIGG